MEKQDKFRESLPEVAQAMADYFTRTYTRTELARAYMPNVEASTARKNFNAWLRSSPGLREELLKLGADSRTRCYTPRQVRLILEQFGLPGLNQRKK